MVSFTHHSYHSVMRLRPTAPTSWNHLLILLKAKKNKRQKQLQATRNEAKDTSISSNGKDTPLAITHGNLQVALKMFKKSWQNTNLPTTSSDHPSSLNLILYYVFLVLKLQNHLFPLHQVHCEPWTVTNSSQTNPWMKGSPTHHSWLPDQSCWQIYCQQHLSSLSLL